MGARPVFVGDESTEHPWLCREDGDGGLGLARLGWDKGRLVSMDVAVVAVGTSVVGFVFGFDTGCKVVAEGEDDTAEIGI